MRISDWSSDVCSSDLLAHRGAKVDVAQVGRDDRHPYLVGAVDLAGTDGLDHVGHRVQGHRARAAGIDDQVADVVDRAAVRGLRAYQHVDLAVAEAVAGGYFRSEEHTSELQSLMRISYAVFCLKKTKTINQTNNDKNRCEY